MTGNIELVKIFKDNGILKEYACFMKLKGLHANGRIYNYSAFKLANQSGLSRTLINTYIPFFLKHGWCRMEGDSLVFISKEKLRLKYEVKVFCGIAVDTSRSINEIKDDLLFELAKEGGCRWEHQKQLSLDQSKPKDLKAYKRGKKSKEIIGEMGDRYAVSLYTLSERLGVSISSVSRLLKTRVKEKFNRVSCLGVGVMYCDGYYNYSGKVFKVIMNEYIF